VDVHKVLYGPAGTAHCSSHALASLEDVSLLLAHHSVEITERHYLKFDRRRQDRLTRAAMVDFEQAEVQNHRSNEGRRFYRCLWQKPWRDESRFL
jgi:hypothetical protein